MRRFVTATPTDPQSFARALTGRYAEAFDLQPVASTLSGYEERKAEELDAMFAETDWLQGTYRPSPPVRRVKIRSGVWVFSTDFEGTTVAGSVIGDRLERLLVSDGQLNGSAGSIERHLRGRTLPEAAEAAVRYGDPGRRIAEALERCDGRAP
jgi:hypothetical protein